MLNFFRSSKALVKDDLSANTTNEVAGLLQRLRDTHSKVFIQFEGENVSYACSVGAYNLQHAVVVVSDLCSDIPAATLQRGRVVHILMREQGRRRNIECRYVEPLVENQFSALQLQLR